jgi:farnesyl diphosphate synthase
VLAAAIECIHSYSLVHDDLPAMDDDDLRRGRPTCHIVYGEAHAILAGDALQTLAFDLIANHSFNVPAQQQLKMIAALAKASGIEGMVGGQALDIAATDKLVNLAELERIHKLKTGALLNCAITLGALCAADTNQQTLLQLKQFGDAIGLAFQVQDDILDIEGDTQVLGKPQGSDVAANKATYPALLGLTGAKQKAQSLLKCALDALAAIDADTSELENLAKYIVERDY